MANFKLAIGAGHIYDTPGKRCLKSLDPNETREWTLNDRICDRVEKLLAEYDGIEILRVDDTYGKQPISVSERNKAANNWGADFALAVHHNAGMNGGKGGGIVAYVCNGVGQDTTSWQSALYAALIAHTGLRGNRANPLAVADFQMLTGTKMPAVLLELGFMDSATDVPIILTDEYAQQCAEAITEVIVKNAKLTKKNAWPANITREEFDFMMDDWMKRRAAMPPSEWSADDRMWAEKEGIILGDGKGNMNYCSFCSREEVCVMLHRMAENNEA